MSRQIPPRESRSTGQEPFPALTCDQPAPSAFWWNPGSSPWALGRKLWGSPGEHFGLFGGGGRQDCWREVGPIGPTSSVHQNTAETPSSWDLKSSWPCGPSRDPRGKGGATETSSTHWPSCSRRGSRLHLKLISGKTDNPGEVMYLAQEPGSEVYVHVCVCVRDEARQQG